MVRGKHRRRQGRSRRVSATNNSNNNRFSNLLIRARCRSARARLFLPNHRRLRLYPPVESSGEEVRLRQVGVEEWRPVPGSPPNHRGHQHRKLRRDHKREAGDECRDRVWMNRNGRGPVSESSKGRGDTDHLFYFFNYFSLLYRRVVLSFLHLHYSGCL